MKNFALLVLIALFAIAVLLFIYNPQLLENVWLWIVGLIGPIIASVKRLFDSFSSRLSPEGRVTEKKGQKAEPAASQSLNINDEKSYQQKFSDMQNKIAALESQLQQAGLEADDFDGQTLVLLRYFSDSETTLGLLFVEGKFFSYVLEDAFNEPKIPKKTRIPKGTYDIDYNKADTPLTLKYRDSRSWFTYHLLVKDVPNFTGIYIHVGNSNVDTEGCLLIADGISHSDTQQMIVHSSIAYERFYKKISKFLNRNIKVRIKIFDEDWLTKSNLMKLTA